MSMVKDFKEKIKKVATILDINQNECVMHVIATLCGDDSYLADNYDFEEDINIEDIFNTEFSSYKFVDLANTLRDNPRVHAGMGSFETALLTVTNGEEFLQISYKVNSYGTAESEYFQYSLKTVKPVQRTVTFYE